MAWTSPRTWVTGEIVTASHMNVHLRDNTIDLDRRTSPTTAVVAASETTTSVGYTDLATAGPAVTVTVGGNGKVLIGIYATGVANSGANYSAMSFRMDGASTWAGEDEHSLLTATTTAISLGAVWVRQGLAAGSTTFKAQYRVSAGTGAFAGRRLWVTPLSS